MSNTVSSREVIAAVLLRAALIPATMGTTWIFIKSGQDVQTVIGILLVSVILALFSIAVKLGIQ